MTKQDTIAKCPEGSTHPSAWWFLGLTMTPRPPLALKEPSTTSSSKTSMP
jgi:hypothetical protein